MAEPAEQTESQPSLWAITRAFWTIGFTSMGGGRIAYFYHEFVRRRRWVSDTELLESFAISQVLPGPNVSNLAVLLGARLRGLAGSLLAALGLLTPGAILVMVLSAIYFGGGHLPALGSVLRGAAAASAGMAVATAFQVGWRIVRTPLAAALALLTLALVALRLPTLGIVLLLGVVGTLLHRPRGDRS